MLNTTNHLNISIYKL